MVCPCPLLDGLACVVGDGCSEGGSFSAMAVASLEGRWLGGESVVETELWCMSLMRGLLAVKGRPRLHWQVGVEEGAGSGRGGVVCMVAAMGGRLGGCGWLW